LWEELSRQYAGPVAVALVIGYLMRYVEPRSRVVHWFPAWFRFQVPLQDGTMASIWTHALSIQNVGWRAAAKVEIIHQARPQYFQLQPGVKFSESTNPTGEHVISIDSLGRGEFVTIQILSAGGQPPNVVGVKSADGQSRFTSTQQRFVIPKSRQWVLLLLLVVGFVTTASWVAQMVARYGPLILAR